MAADQPIQRRGVLGLLAAGAAGLPLSQCDDTTAWHDVDVAGSSPALRFDMRRAPDGKQVTAADYRGDIVMLYFGYTFCPDVCPLTLQNTADVFSRMGSDARAVRFLFVTVDPGRDSLAVLAQYVSQFGPNFIGLRGTPDQLANLARRYRIAYSVAPAQGSAPGGTPNGNPIEVTHSSAIYVFDRQGAARLLVPSMASSSPDTTGVAADLTRLMHERPSTLGWLERLVS
ncbi:SCO family protein [Rhodopila sp.]|uniref:SCO family protein n=1 Tax=Rhodopila sp. TaxID=2480087 RepID=UPI003D1026E6